MSTAYHSRKSQFRWIWADDAARTAETDVTAEDVTNQCLGIQDDTGVIYRATDDDPITFDPVTTGGSSSSSEHITEQSSGNTVLAPVAIRRRTSGTPAAGIGVSSEYSSETDSTEDADIGDVGFVFSEVVEPDQSSIFFTHVYYGANRIPVIVVGASDVTPDTIANIIANLGAGGVHIGVITDATLSALGAYSFIIGGDGTNLAEGYGAGVLAGTENSAAGGRSIAHGSGARADFDDAAANAAGYFATPGDAQTQRVPIRGLTPDNTPTVIRVCFIPANTHFGFSLNMVARRVTGTTQGAYYKRRGSGFTGAGLGTITLTSIVVEGTDVEDDTAWDLTATVDAVSNSLQVVATGATADDVQWSGMLEIWWTTG